MQDKLCDICNERNAEYVVTTYEKGVEHSYEICELDYVRLRRRQQLKTSKPLSKYFNEDDPLEDLSVLVSEGEAFEPDNELREVAVTAKDYFELEEFFSDDTRDVLLATADIARAFGWDAAKSEHLLLALLEYEDIQEILDERDVNVDGLITYIEEKAPKSSSFKEPFESETPEEEEEQGISQEVHEVLKESLNIAHEYDKDYIYPRHLLISLFTANTLAGYILEKFDLNEDIVREALGY